MKQKLAVPSSRALADFLPAITIKAKDFANEVTNMQIKQQDLRDEPDISREHVKNNQDVRKILTDRNIQPESLPPAEDVKKVERSEEHTSELQSLMRISYAVFCLKTKKKNQHFLNILTTN